MRQIGGPPVGLPAPVEHLLVVDPVRLAVPEAVRSARGEGPLGPGLHVRHVEVVRPHEGHPLPVGAVRGNLLAIGRGREAAHRAGERHVVRVIALIEEERRLVGREVEGAAPGDGLRRAGADGVDAEEASSRREVSAKGAARPVAASTRSSLPSLTRR